MSVDSIISAADEELLRDPKRYNPELFRLATKAWGEHDNISQVDGFLGFVRTEEGDELVRVNHTRAKHGMLVLLRYLAGEFAVSPADALPVPGAEDCSGYTITDADKRFAHDLGFVAPEALPLHVARFRTRVLKADRKQRQPVSSSDRLPVPGAAVRTLVARWESATFFPAQSLAEIKEALEADGLASQELPTREALARALSDVWYDSGRWLAVADKATELLARRPATDEPPPGEPTYAQLQKSHDLALEQVRDLESALTNERRERDQIEALSDEVDASKLALMRERDEALARASHWEAQHCAVSAVLKPLEQERDGLRQERDELQGAQVLNRNAIAGLRRERDEALARLAQVAEERDKHKAVRARQAKRITQLEALRREVDESNYRAWKFADDARAEALAKLAARPEPGQLQIEHESMRKRWVEATDERDQLRATLQRIEHAWCIEGDYAPDGPGDTRHPVTRRIEAMQAMHTADVEKLRNQLHEVERERDVLRQELAEVTGQAEQVEGDLALLRRERDEARASVESLTATLRDVQEDRRRLEDVIAETKRKADDHRRQRDEAQAQLEQLREEHSFVSAELKGVQERLAARPEPVVVDEALTQRIWRAYYVKHGSKAGEVALLHALREELGERVSLAGPVRMHSDACDEHLLQLERENGQLRAELQAAREELNDALGNKPLQELKDELDECKRRIEGYQGTDREIRGKWNAELKEVGRLHRELQAAQTRLDDYEKRLEPQYCTAANAEMDRLVRERSTGERVPLRPRLATDMPAPRELSAEEMRAATEEARELRKRMDKAMEGMEGPPMHAPLQPLSERVNRVEAALRHYLGAWAEDVLIEDAARDALAMLDAGKQEVGK